VTWADEDYPRSLREIADAPVVLYVKGSLPSDDPLSLSIVGSRRASIYGISISEKFAYNLAELGFTIVSGLARGIDTAAHNGALKAFGTTVAVLGCGLDHVYPPENRDLLEKIAETGAIVSEFPMQVLPLPHNFPRRNRIISGLSSAVIVVEAAQRSGALITADFALEQGRDVFAVPGKIDQASSGGVNNLIKQGAKLITCVEDIVEDMAPRVCEYLEGKNRGSKVHPCTDRLDNLTNEEKLVYGYITDRPVHIDELTHCCEGTVPVMSVLLRLELKRLVKQLPGKLFVR
jgi:DNA processing protein